MPFRIFSKIRRDIRSSRCTTGVVDISGKCKKPSIIKDLINLFRTPLGGGVGTVTFFIQTFFIRYKVYTNFLYTGQSLYGTKFIQDKVYTGTKNVCIKIVTVPWS